MTGVSGTAGIVTGQVTAVRVEVRASAGASNVTVDGSGNRGRPVAVTYEATALEDIPVYCAVVAYVGGLWRADVQAETHGGRLNGVATHSARAGEALRVALMGPLAGWGGAQGRLWVGSNGQPVTDPPPGRWRQVVGFSVEPGVLIVQLKPVILSSL